MEKIFLTYEQQIKKLQLEKKLTISDYDYAKEILSKISYYSLVSGYKELFKHAPSGKYIYGVTIEEIAEFYHFDEELRLLFLKYILQVERHLKSLISYHFCEKYGENQEAYLNQLNYTMAKKHQHDVGRLVKSLETSISLPSQYSYITHYVKQHGNVPLWVVMNTVTIGTLSKMYQYITNDVQAKVSANFANVTERELHEFLTVVAKFRNVCAHGERLYNYRSRDAGPDTKLHEKLMIPQKKGQYRQGKRDLFAVVIALRYLIETNEFKKFKSSLVRLIRNVVKKCPHVTEEQLLKEMGFPGNWQNMTRYKK